jgi:hypothetical protein
LPGKVASAFSESANTTTAQAINTPATISAGKWSRVLLVMVLAVLLL